MRIAKAWGTQGSEEIKSDAIGSVDDIPWSGDMRWAHRSNSAPATENAAAFTLKPVAFSSPGSNRPQDWGAKPARRCRVRGSEEEESFSNCTHSIIQILFFKRTYVVNKNMAEKEHQSEPFTLPAFHILSHSVMAKGRNGNLGLFKNSIPFKKFTLSSCHVQVLSVMEDEEHNQDIMHACPSRLVSI